MDQYALRRFPSVPTRRTVSQQDEHFQIWVRVPLCHTKESVSLPQMQDPTVSSSQETGKPQWTTFVQNQVFAAGESAPDRPPCFSVCRVPGAASATVPQPFSSGPDSAEAQLWSRAESLAASKCLSRQVHPDGGCRVLNPPGFPSQHSSSIKNTCQSQKVHLGPDSQGSPVLCAGCL